jgi:hypothetical protein
MIATYAATSTVPLQLVAKAVQGDDGMRVLIVDDHELFRAGLALLLRELYPGIELLQACITRAANS